MNKNSQLNQPHIVHSDIQALIETCSELEGVRVRQVGESFEQRSIHLLSLGHGPIVIFAWTQMHGNEATATAAVFDLIEQLMGEQATLPAQLQGTWQQKFTLHILPMLNPDGAERCIRHNAQGIDINRDAKSLQTPEGRLLMSLVDELKPNIGFNLHDQSPYYQCGTTGNPSTIAFLAPAFDDAKTIDAARQLAMQIIASMNTKLQSHIADCVARYDDTYSFRSFGDNIAAKQISTILIESGAAIDDPNRQIARKMNVTAILSAMAFLSTEHENSANNKVDDYFAIPENVSEALSSLVIKDLSFASKSPYAYSASVSVKQSARYSNKFFIDFVGDLGMQAGLQTIDASSLQYTQGKNFNLSAALEAHEGTEFDYTDLLRQGYLSIYAHSEAHKSCLLNTLNYPVHWRNTPSAVLGTQHALVLNQAAYFLLAKQGEICAAVLNGHYVDLK